MKCDICNEEIIGAPFTIVTPWYRIENVCGECMNLYTNEEYDELYKHMPLKSSDLKDVWGKER